MFEHVVVWRRFTPFDRRDGTRHLTAEGRDVRSADPNQPANGVAVLGETPEDEVALLCRTYESADPPARELMRLIAAVAILEQLQHKALGVRAKAARVPCMPVRSGVFY